MAQTDLRRYGTEERLSKMDLDLITVTPTIETSTIDANDVLFNPIEIPYATSVPGGRSLLHSICLVDTTDTATDAGVAIDLVFTKSATNLGTLDAAVSGADSVMEDILGVVSIVADDYVDLINANVATKTSIGLTLISSEDTTTSCYVAGIIRETGTARDADAILLKIGLLKD